MHIATVQPNQAEPLDESGVWMFNSDRCSAKRFRTAEFANLVAQEYVAWMKHIDPSSRWEVDPLPANMEGHCFPCVIDPTARPLFDRSRERTGWEKLHGPVITNESGVPIGVLVTCHDGLEAIERFFTIGGNEVGRQSLGW